MTKFYDEFTAIINKIDKAAESGEIRTDEVMFLAGMMMGAASRLTQKYSVVKKT